MGGWVNRGGLVDPEEGSGRDAACAKGAGLRKALVGADVGSPGGRETGERGGRALREGFSLESSLRIMNPERARNASAKSSEGSRRGRPAGLLPRGSSRDRRFGARSPGEDVGWEA